METTTTIQKHKQPNRVDDLMPLQAYLMQGV